ncbi:ABC transporter ATP-binding protein [Neolewinella agarilytica]|uniref:ABC-type multidrug transport system, ATPase and permease component n=1 Tax=Neolewinella agarilytica TaxID=478744 RepID=A0A1H9GDF4_9BACT|nr:ABC transporter ATP-binding protein [Neolewinella agarilytica]SEQ48114.1 ABC-type multidrug transport system, ATPase and permease component [Neolewinella agarilytica]
MSSYRESLRNLFRKNPYKFLLATAWRYAEGMRGRYLLIYLMFTGVNLLVSLPPLIFGFYINFLQQGEGDPLRGTLIYVAIYIGINLGLWMLQWPARLMERRMAFDISQKLLMESYDKIIHLPLAWHREHHSGDTINRARKAYEALKNFFDNGFAYFQTIARMVFAIGAIVWFSPVFGLIALVFGVIILLTVLGFDEPIIKANKETNDRENELMAGLSDNLGNIITVTTLRLGKRTAQAIRKRIGNVWPPFLKNTKVNEAKWFSVSTLVSLMYAVLVTSYVWSNRVPGEVFLVGGLVTLIGYINQFSGSLSNLTAQYNQIIRFRSDLAAIEPIDEAHELAARPSAAGPIRRDWTELTVSNLNFRYAEDGAGIHDLSLNLDRGRRVALIGPSGSGKTTTLYTLRGLYPPEEITLHFNETQHLRPRLSLPKDSGAQLFSQTTLIPQSPEIFEETLRNNLTMGLDRSGEELERAIHLSVLEDVIEQADDGLNTFLSEGGANLSGGQRQRLSIARGILAADTSTLLLLDEPTSSLDPNTEIMVYERLFAAFPDKTIVSTLHRLHLLRYFDHIYYMENGRIQAEGTLEELLERSQAFKAMYLEQVGV